MKAKRTLGLALPFALALAGCSTLTSDLAFGDLESRDAKQVTVTLGHTDDQTRYLIVCPKTSAKDLAKTLGFSAPAKYPEDGYEDKSALLLFDAQNQAKIRTYDLSRFNLCKSSTGWEVTDITTPLKMTKDDDGSWYASPTSTTTSASTDDTGQGHAGVHPSQGHSGTHPGQDHSGQDHAGTPEQMDPNPAPASPANQVPQVGENFKIPTN
ncbi:hypothetical protein CAQU_03765 [Corynebacterium aquilae DSM 44791]|uniref:Lipoprotein n=1 Tax=Corynebacterium aquilae DSM 44791 TaxID=1431546 RepID=A0A1L7CES3_9CORY|nr:hypothetical protein CAQU_03765 [Corynebacterium aquilae DSM 44791]